MKNLSKTQKGQGMQSVGVALGLSLATYIATSLFCGGQRLAHAQASGELALWITLVMMAALLCCAYFTATLGKKETTLGRYALRAGLLIAALVARVALFDGVTSDYENFLAKWVDIFRTEGFSAVAQTIGDYNLPYQYILALIAKSPVYDMYLIKLVSVAFDFALALLMMRMVERFIDTRMGTLTLGVVLFSPTVLLNGAYWAQCDALYAFFVVASLYAMLRERPIRSVVWMALAFSFKLQTIFFFPMVLFGLWHKKYKLRHALVFPATYLATLVPALAVGRSLSSALMIYVNQSVGQYFERLTYNAANIYTIFPVFRIGDASQYKGLLKAIPELVDKTQTYISEANMMDLQTMALILAAALVLAALAFFVYARKEIGLDQVWGIALFSALFLPMVMPKMHDRYFYLAEIFSILYAARHPKRFYVPLFVIGASLISYAPFIMRQVPVPLMLGSALNLAALIIVARDIFTALRGAASERGLAKQ